MPEGNAPREAAGPEQVHLAVDTSGGRPLVVVEGAEPWPLALLLEQVAAAANTAFAMWPAGTAASKADQVVSASSDAPDPVQAAQAVVDGAKAQTPPQEPSDAPPVDAVYTTPEGLSLSQSDLDQLREQTGRASSPRVPTRPVLVQTREGVWETQEQPGPWRMQTPPTAGETKAVSFAAPDQFRPQQQAVATQGASQSEAVVPAAPSSAEPSGGEQTVSGRARAVAAEETRVDGAREIDAGEGDGAGAEALANAGAEVSKARSLLAKAVSNDARALNDVDEHLRRAELYRQQASIAWAEARERSIRNGKLGENVATATAVGAVATVGLAGGALVAGSAVAAGLTTVAEAAAVKAGGALGGGALALAVGGVGESLATGKDFLATRLGSGAVGYGEGIEAAADAPFEAAVAMVTWLREFYRDPEEALAAAVRIPWLKQLVEDPQRLADAIAAVPPQEIARGTGHLIGESAAGAAIGSVGGSVVGGLAGPGGALATATGTGVAGALAGGASLAAAGASSGGVLGALDAVVSMMAGKKDPEAGSAPEAGTQGHHTYPKALGGHPDQALSDLLEALHTGKGGVHSDLATFESGWLRPKRGMTGAQIVEKYGEARIVEGLRRFYSQEKWRHLLPDFEEAVRFTKKKAREAAGGSDAP